MQLDIRSTHLALGPDTLVQIRGRFEQGLDHFAQYILGGRILLSDVNGPKGGADKHCLVQLRLRRVPGIVIAEEGPDLFSVAGRAVDRLAVAVGRAVEKGRCHRRQEHSPRPFDGRTEGK